MNNKDDFKDFGNPINILTQNNSKQIDIDVFIPLYKHLCGVFSNRDTMNDMINTTKIPQDIKNISRMIHHLGRIWEEFIQKEIKKFVIGNKHLKYFSKNNDKKIVTMSNGSIFIIGQGKVLTEFDVVLLYHNKHPIIIEIKNSTHKGSGTSYGGGHYQSKMKIARDIFSDYDKSLFLKIRVSKKKHKIGLTSRFPDHRKIAMIHSPVLTDLKQKLERAKKHALKSK